MEEAKDAGTFPLGGRGFLKIEIVLLETKFEMGSVALKSEIGLVAL